MKTNDVNQYKHTEMQRFAWHCQKTFYNVNRAKLVPVWAEWSKWCKHIKILQALLKVVAMEKQWHWPLVESLCLMLQIKSTRWNYLSNNWKSQWTTLYRCTSYVFSSVPCGGGYICVAKYSPAMWTTLLIVLTCVCSGPSRICRHAKRTLVDWAMYALKKFC